MFFSHYKTIENYSICETNTSDVASRFYHIYAVFFEFVLQFVTKTAKRNRSWKHDGQGVVHNKNGRPERVRKRERHGENQSSFFQTTWFMQIVVVLNEGNMVFWRVVMLLVELLIHVAGMSPSRKWIWQIKSKPQRKCQMEKGIRFLHYCFPNKFVCLHAFAVYYKHIINFYTLFALICIPTYRRGNANAGSGRR